MEQHNQYESAHPTLHDVQSKETHNIVLLWGSSTRNEFRALAVQTNMAFRRVERLDSVITLDEGDSLDFGMLQSDGHESDPDTSTDPSKDILRIDDNKSETLVEWSISVEPDDVYVGVQNPKTSTVSGLQGDRLRREIGVEDLDRHGVLSQHTRTAAHVPTTALSSAPDQGLPRIDSEDEGRNPIRVGFLNDSSEQKTIDVAAHGVAYHVTPITDPEIVERMVFGDGLNRRVISWGNFENTNPNIPTAWKDGRIELTDEDVRDVVGNWV